MLEECLISASTLSFPNEISLYSPIISVTRKDSLLNVEIKVL